MDGRARGAPLDSSRALLPAARAHVHDRQKLEQELALLLKRSAQRGQRAGAIGCGSVIALAFVLSPTGLLESSGGWALLMGAFFVLMMIFGRRAARESTADFQSLYRAERGGAGRREAALTYLWRRAHPTHRNTKPDKAALEILKELGVTRDPESVVRQDDALAPARLEPEALVAPPPEDARPAPPPRAPAVPAPKPARADVHGTPTSAPQAQAQHTPPPRALPPAPTPPHPAAASHGVGPSHSAATPHPTAWRKPDAAARSVPAPAAWSPPAAERAAPAPVSTPVTPQPAAQVEPARAPASAASAATPAAQPALSASPARRVRCDYCGDVRTLAAGEALTSCPVCFPQIRLES